MTWNISIRVLPLNYKMKTKADNIFSIDKYQSYQGSGPPLAAEMASLIEKETSALRRLIRG